MENNRNWAGNYRYSALELHVPENVGQVQELVARSSRMKVLGTRHSFNGIADSTGSLLSLEKLNRVIALDRTRNKVTVEAGIRYGELCQYLYSNGYALHNLASLPHITVAGAVATATHGSGDLNGNLATAVYSLEVVKADGEMVVFSREQQDGVIAGAVVGLGGLGVVTKITLDVIPVFQMSQYVYDNLPLVQLKEHFNDIFSSAYSVSLFTDWKESTFNQVWIKRRLTDQALVQEEPEFFGAIRATAHRHPVPGFTSEN
ncbi:MAG: FAD-binding protein, partial [Paenibacillus sp.]|nr:FAD-binding protein [Paenibacillus sp.]